MQDRTLDWMQIHSEVDRAIPDRLRPEYMTKEIVAQAKDYAILLRRNAVFRSATECPLADDPVATRTADRPADPWFSACVSVDWLPLGKTSEALIAKIAPLELNACSTDSSPKAC